MRHFFGVRRCCNSDAMHHAACMHVCVVSGKSFNHVRSPLREAFSLIFFAFPHPDVDRAKPIVYGATLSELSVLRLRRRLTQRDMQLLIINVSAGEMIQFNTTVESIDNKAQTTQQAHIFTQNNAMIRVHSIGSSTNCHVLDVLTICSNIHPPGMPWKTHRDTTTRNKLDHQN